MSDKRNKELFQRIAKLVRENKELTEKVKKLTEITENLTQEKEELKNKLSSDYPEKTIKTGKKPKTLSFNMVTVLFADIVGFKNISDQTNSQDMIDELDEIYFHFDNISKKYNIEKIKTIGDTYMCAGGVPEKNVTNSIDVVLAALEMREYLNQLKEKYKKEDKTFWDMKLGIHTGPVTATSSGKKKISYDIKGDTVNIASRMNSSGEPGKINISVMTYELVKDFFTCDYHGKMPVKYIGDVEMYFVRRVKLALSVERKGIEANDIFNTKYALRKFTDLQEIILDRLEKELPGHLYYHNVKHTIDVVTQAELIGLGEGVSDEDILLLKTAALFHDAGHIIGYQDHELKSTHIAREYLPDYKYTPKQIDKICAIIMATQLPPEPKTLLEKIICDSDLDYLGRSDFIPVSNTLYKELKEQNMIGTLNDWNKLQIKFLSGHHYFTETAKSLREVNKQEQIERIKKLIE